MTTQASGPYEPYVPQLLLDWPAATRHREIEGSLVHVDISGFTAMSERLARKGRVGAEEVSAVLNRTFTELLTIADHHGGDLLKFGGDALLILFVKEGHALRSVRAAASMRARLRSIGKIQTPAGRVELKMTVGVHSGVLDAFLLGSTHRELIVAGSAATTTVAVEEAAEAGEILLSPQTAALVPERFLGTEKGPGVLLARTPPPTDYEPPHIFCREECRLFIPTALREVVAAPTEGEHRRITIGFIKFSGTDEMLAEGDPTAAADALEELVNVVQDATAEFDVTFLSTDIDAGGGKIIIAGGVPIATGRDEERVLRALRQIADTPLRLPLEIGVNYGPAFSGDIGAPFRRAYTVIGDAVNLAARVMGRAEPGDVLATAGVIDRSDTQFEAAELPPFTVKGKSEPVQAWKIGAISGRRRSDAADAPLFGREAELSMLEPYFDGSRSVGLIDISGGAGIGKSRLIRELRTTHSRHAWRFGDCDPYEASTPYYVFRRLLREVAGIVRGISPAEAADRLAAVVGERAPHLVPWIPLLATAMDVPAAETVETARLGAEFRQARLHQTAAEFVDAMVDEPCVLVVEDAQWIDEESRALMDYLAKAAANRPWLIIAVHRPSTDVPARVGQVALELESLAEQGARALVEHALADTALLEHQLRDIVDRADGNPLFLLELVAATRSGEAMPDSVESLVQARIDRLDRVKRQLLRYSSVAGMSFDPELLADALGDDIPEIRDLDAWDGLDEFLVRRSSGELRFRQSLFHDVAYGGISFRVRSRLHKQIGRVLEREAADPEELAEVLSLHFLLARDFSRAWEYSRSAGLQACGKHANVAATRFYERALEAARHVDLEPVEIARVAESLGNVAEPAGLHDEAERGLRRAAELRIGDDGGRARIFRKLGLLRERSGKYPQALRWFTRGLKQVGEPTTDRELLQRTELQLAYAGVRFRQARYHDTIDWAEKAIPAAEKLEAQQATAHGYYLLALARMRSGETRKQGNTERALAIYEELGDLVGQSNVLNKLGVDAYHAGQWTKAREYYARSKEARQKAGDSVRAAIITQNEALVLSDQGRLDEAEDLFRHALREFQAADDQMAIGVATSNLGRILIRRRQFSEGLDLLQTALAELSAIGAEEFVIDAEIRIAEAYILSGDVGRGERLIDAIEAKLTSPADERQCLLQRIRAYGALEQSSVDEAVRLLETASAEARSRGNRYELGLQLDVLAKVTEDSSVRTEADQILDQLGIATVPDLPGRVLAG